LKEGRCHGNGKGKRHAFGEEEKRGKVSALYFATFPRFSKRGKKKINVRVEGKEERLRKP